MLLIELLLSNLVSPVLRRGLGGALQTNSSKSHTTINKNVSGELPRIKSAVAFLSLEDHKHDKNISRAKNSAYTREHLLLNLFGFSVGEASKSVDVDFAYDSGEHFLY